MKVHYVYHDYPDSALNLGFFLGNFPLDQVESVSVSACSFKHFDRTKIPASVNIEMREDDVDMFAHYKWLTAHTKQACDVLLLNSSCIGPLYNTVTGDSFLDAIKKFLGKYDLIAPIVEVPPDAYGAKSIEDHKYILKDELCVPFAHSYCLFISARGVTAIHNSGILSNNYREKKDAIMKCERQITAVILNNKLPIMSLLRMHKDLDFTDKKNWVFSKFSSDASHTCPEGPENYFGADIDPYEVIFYKNIRHSGPFRGKDRSGITAVHSNYISRILLNKSSTL